MLTHYLPLEQDETLYSWLVTACVTSGYPSYREALSAFNIKKDGQLASSFPNYLTQVTYLSGVAKEHLIQHHSVLRLFQSFIDRQTASKAIKDFSAGKVGSLHSSLSLIANRISCTPTLSYCSQCALEDLERCGRAYWHIAHQLPGVTVCIKHGCLLSQIKPSRKAVYLPVIERTPCESLPVRVDMQLSKLLFDAWQRPVLSHSTALNHCYRQRMNECAFLTSGLGIRQRRLSKKIRRYWQNSKSEKVIQVLSHGNYPETFIRNSRANFHPLKHILFIGMLWPEWSAFCDSLASSQILHNESCMPIEVFPEPPDRRIIEYLKRGDSLREVANTFGKSVPYVKKLAVQNNISIDHRTQRLFAAERQSILDMLTKGGKTQVIANAHSCSVGAVEQILSQHPELIQKRHQYRFEKRRAKHRHEISQLLNNAKGLSRGQIQAAKRSSYTWLYKWDRQWLYSVLPAAIDRRKRYIRQKNE